MQAWHPDAIKDVGVDVIAVNKNVLFGGMRVMPVQALSQRPPERVGRK